MGGFLADEILTGTRTTSHVVTRSFLSESNASVVPSTCYTALLSPCLLEARRLRNTPNIITRNKRLPHSVSVFYLTTRCATQY